MIIDEYLRPGSAQEAYDLLVSEEESAIIGGGAYIRMSNRHIKYGIDLSRAGLDFIRETDSEVEIGAMANLRELEKSELINRYWDGLITRAVSNILGVQMRIIITVGGVVYGRYGFSDLLAALLALDASVKLYKRGEVSLEEFMKDKTRERDVIEKIIIRKENIRASYQVLRNTSTDFPILNAAVAKKGSEYRIVVGSRPGYAILAGDAMAFLKDREVSEENAIKAGDLAAEGMEFGSDLRASGEYRKEMCRVLVKRGIMEVK